MEKEDFINEYKYVFYGIMDEASRGNAKGSEAGMALDLRMARIQAELAKAWHALNPISLPKAKK